jgi:ATP phosphoribosyltransferase
LIVDITTTGTTLAANGLMVVDDGVMLRSEANLIAARGAQWDERRRATARQMLDRIAAQDRAHGYREVRTRFPGCNDTLLNEARERFGVFAPFGGPTSSGMLTLHCPPQQVFGLADFMREKGAEAISVAEIEYVFTRANPLYAKLEAALG